MNTKIDDVNSKFSSNYSSLLCNVIIKWQQESEDLNGSIDWPSIASLLNQKISESEGRERQNDDFYNGIDCHKQWRYLAYGETRNGVETDPDNVLSVENSDEVNF
jgi:hypothetical protein